MKSDKLEKNKHNYTDLKPLYRIFERMGARWRSNKTGVNLHPMNFWLSAPELSDARRKNFNLLKSRLEECDFNVTFNGIREEFKNHQCNEHVLYFLCAECLSWDGEVPLQEDYRRLRQILNRKTMGLSSLDEASEVLEELLPVLYRVEEYGSLKIPPHPKLEGVKNILREFRPLIAKMIKDADNVPFLNTRGRKVNNKAWMFVALLPDYFRVVADGPKLQLVSRIRALLGNSVSLNTTRDQDAFIREIPSDENPLVYLDRALR